MTLHAYNFILYIWTFLNAYFMIVFFYMHVSFSKFSYSYFPSGGFSTVLPLVFASTNSHTIYYRRRKTAFGRRENSYFSGKTCGHPAYAVIGETVSYDNDVSLAPKERARNLNLIISRPGNIILTP